MNSVLLVDGESMHSIPVSYCLAAANRTVHVGSAKRLTHVRFSRFPTKFHWWGDTSRLLDHVRSYAARERSEVIMGCSDAGIRFVSENRRELEMTTSVAGTSSVLSLDTAADKAKFAAFLAGTTLAHPETIILPAGQPPPRKLPGFPALLKPARGSGGVSIKYLQRENAFGQYVENHGLGERTWILQSYIQGRDAGCNVLCRNGKILALTVQISIEPVSISFSPAPGVDFIHDDGALDLVERLVAALQWTGVAHIDMLRGERDGRFFVIEMNGRYWASMLGSYRAGVNFPDLACLDALGRDVSGGAYPGISGLFADLRGWDGARRDCPRGPYFGVSPIRGRCLRNGPGRALGATGVATRNGRAEENRMPGEVDRTGALC